MGEVGTIKLKTDRFKAVLLLLIIIVFRVCHSVLYVHFSLVNILDSTTDTKHNIKNDLQKKHRQLLGSLVCDVFLRFLALSRGVVATIHRSNCEHTNCVRFHIHTG